MAQTRNTPIWEGPKRERFTAAGDEWSAVQQRAKEIKAKLDAGKWDELGLGP